MKRAYSRYIDTSAACLKAYNLSRKECDYEKSLETSRKLYDEYFQKATGVPNICKNSFIILDFFSLYWKFKKFNHYFLSPGLLSFFTESAKKLTKEYFGAVPLNQLMAIHFPINERKESILIYAKGDYGFCTDGNVASRFHVADFDASLDERCDHIKIESTSPGIPSKSEFMQNAKTLNEITRILFGFSLYIDAFPDTVVPAQMGEIANWNHHQGVKNIVKRCEEIEIHDRNAVHPHWRRGHFRLLSSPKYTKKQFQTVFVRGTFVKGTAFDVLSDTPPTGGNGQ